MSVATALPSDTAVQAGLPQETKDDAPTAVPSDGAATVASLPQESKFDTVTGSSLPQAPKVASPSENIGVVASVKQVNKDLKR